MFNERLVKRTWGWYWTILNRKHFKVKLLRFWKDKSCSKQFHNFRSELWLFLSGSGQMMTLDRKGFNPKNGDYFEVELNDCVEIPTKTTHIYTAITPTLVLEIQYGEKCIEEDIVRV